MKRGERAPWRVMFSYGNGVSGRRAFTTRDRAELFVAELVANAERRGLDFSWAITNRDADVT